MGSTRLGTGAALDRPTTAEARDWSRWSDQRDADDRP